MLGLPKGDEFFVLLGDNFLYPEIIDRYKAYFDRKNFIFNNMLDYINASIIGVNIAGISSNSTQQNKGGIKIAHRTGKKSADQMNKTMRLTFQTRAGFLNWFIMNDLVSMYIDSASEKSSGDFTGNDTFLPPITVFFRDDDGNIIYERIHTNIVAVKIDDLNLVKTDNKVSRKEFSVTFEYGQWNNKYNILEDPDVTNPIYSY